MKYSKTHKNRPRNDFKAAQSLDIESENVYISIFYEDRLGVRLIAYSFDNTAFKV